MHSTKHSSHAPGFIPTEMHIHKLINKRTETHKATLPTTVQAQGSHVPVSPGMDKSIAATHTKEHSRAARIGGVRVHALLWIHLTNMWSNGRSQTPTHSRVYLHLWKECKQAHWTHTDTSEDRHYFWKSVAGKPKKGADMEPVMLLMNQGGRGRCVLHLWRSITLCTAHGHCLSLHTQMHTHTLVYMHTNMYMYTHSLWC